MVGRKIHIFRYVICLLGFLWLLGQLLFVTVTTRQEVEVLPLESCCDISWACREMEKERGSCRGRQRRMRGSQEWRRPNKRDHAGGRGR